MAIAKKKISHSEHRQMNRDHRKAAKAANLSYVTDCTEGIHRQKRGKNFQYIYKNKQLRDKQQLERIRLLVIPPAWRDVWICATASGHIQATGLDVNGRKQYRYHAGWTALRNETKFHRLFEFGKTLPQLRRRLKADIADTGLTEKKVIATVIEVMEGTYIRIGNNGYEKLYGSYGLTTLKDRHVTIKSDQIEFSFVGKKGIEHNVRLRDRRLARIVKQCRDLPGKELFQYLDADGVRKSIHSGMVNSYIQEATGKDFSAKDFRTWAGSVHALSLIRKLEPGGSETETKKNIVGVIDAVSEKLGNSRSICRKYYVHPGLITLYEQNQLAACLSKQSSMKTRGLNAEENSLMHVLKSCL